MRLANKKQSYLTTFKCTTGAVYMLIFGKSRGFCTLNTHNYTEEITFLVLFQLPLKLIHRLLQWSYQKYQFFLRPLPVPTGTLYD